MQYCTGTSPALAVYTRIYRIRYRYPCRLLYDIQYRYRYQASTVVFRVRNLDQGDPERLPSGLLNLTRYKCSLCIMAGWFSTTPSPSGDENVPHAQVGYRPTSDTDNRGLCACLRGTRRACIRSCTCIEVLPRKYLVPRT